MDEPIGKRIKSLRKKSNLTIEQLADKSDISTTYLSDLENGEQDNPTVRTLRKIASTFNVSVSYLIEGQERPRSNKNFGKIVRRLRKKKGLNITQLAEQVEISRSYMSQIELGRIGSPTLDTALKISNALGVSIGQVVYENPRAEKESLKTIELGLSEENTEALKAMREILTDPELSISQIEKIRDEILNYANYLRGEIKDNK